MVLSPAIAAPATIAFFVMLTFLFLVLLVPRGGTIPPEADQNIWETLTKSSSNPPQGKGWMPELAFLIDLPNPGREGK